MPALNLAYLPTADQRVIPQLFGQIEGGSEEKFVLSPWAGENGPPEDPPSDFLILKPDLFHWDWLAALLRCRRRKPAPTILLYSPRGASPEIFLTLADDPRVLVFQDPEQLKRYLEQARTGREGPRKTILFVDDDRNILQAYERSLRKAPWRILTTSGGEQALELIDQERVDLVVTDIKMPDMHGFTLISKIRKANQALPIMVCSAYPGLRQDADLVLYRVAAFMEKPLNLAALEKRMEELLG